jgi:hypothetical protein
MARLARGAAGIVGTGIIGCVVHAAIMASGGYDATGAPLTIGLACGLVAGAVVLGICWGEGRHALAVLIVVGLVAGEGYALIVTAERTLGYRETKQAPLRAAAEIRAKAAQRLADAELALARTADTPRLTRALAAKREADAAVVEKAAERGCAAHCRALLEQQVAVAQQEINAARGEVDKARAAAEREAAEAREAFAALPVPGSASPLADRLGVADWKIDLAAAALASISANGLGAFLIAFAAHGRRREPVRVIAAKAVEVETAEPIEMAQTKTATRDADAEANKFASAVFRPNPSGRIGVAEIRRAYHQWCRERGLPPLSDQEIGASLNALFWSVGLERDGSGPQTAIIGLGWSDKAPGLVLAG